MLNTETDKTAMDMQHKKKESRKLALLILVASLGYFVDIYDLILYNVIKIESLTSLGIPLESESLLFRWQMGGMLIGGLLWGIWGDKRGRLSVLFGSILIYSYGYSQLQSLEIYCRYWFGGRIGRSNHLGE
jgi:putative MFS transporter